MLMKRKLLHEGSREHIFPEQGHVDWNKVYHQIFDPKLAQEKTLENTVSIKFEFHYFGGGVCTDIKTF